MAVLLCLDSRHARAMRRRVWRVKLGCIDGNGGRISTGGRRRANVAEVVGDNVWEDSRSTGIASSEVNNASQ